MLRDTLLRYVRRGKAERKRRYGNQKQPRNTCRRVLVNYVQDTVDRRLMKRLPSASDWDQVHRTRLSGMQNNSRLFLVGKQNSLTSVAIPMKSSRKKSHSILNSLNSSRCICLRKVPNDAENVEALLKSIHEILVHAKLETFQKCIISLRQNYVIFPEPLFPWETREKNF